MAGLISIVVVSYAALRTRDWEPLKLLPMAFALVAYGFRDELAQLVSRRAPRRHGRRDLAAQSATSLSVVSSSGNTH